MHRATPCAGRRATPRDAMVRFGYTRSVAITKVVDPSHPSVTPSAMRDARRRRPRRDLSLSLARATPKRAVGLWRRRRSASDAVCLAMLVLDAVSFVTR